MMNFYNLIDTYALLHNLDKSEALHLWYRGAISAADLLQAYLEDEGIYGYTQQIIEVIKTVGFQHKRDHQEDPWEFKK